MATGLQFLTNHLVHNSLSCLTPAKHNQIIDSLTSTTQALGKMLANDRITLTSADVRGLQINIRDLIHSHLNSHALDVIPM